MASILSGDFSRAIPIVSSLFTVKHFQLHPKEDYVQILIAESEVKDKFPLLLKELGKIGMLATAKRLEYFRWLMPTLRSVVWILLAMGLNSNGKNAPAACIREL